MSVGLWLYTLFTMTIAGQEFVASPTILEIGLVRKLQIECTATADSTLAVITQIRILFNNSGFVQLGAIDSISGLDNTSGAVDSGEIVRNGKSKLRLTWIYPKHDRAGVYECDIRGENDNGIPKTMSKTVKVTAVIPDQETILNYIQKITSDLEDLKAASARQELIYSVMIDRLERWKSKLFLVSNAFQGRRYYLPSNSNVLVVGDAEATCEIFGGYLVEIDSDEEYQFIVGFLSNFPKYNVVLTGGSDEVKENKWINSYSKTLVKYVKWAPGEPNNGRAGNCLYFWRDGGYKIADDDCTRDKEWAYMCEMDE